MIRDFREMFLPSLDGNGRRRAGVAFNDVRFDHGFQIQLVPVFGRLFEHRIQVHGIGDYLARRFGSFPQNSCQDNDRLSVTPS